jgi:hypothetical protein
MFDCLLLQLGSYLPAPCRLWSSHTGAAAGLPADSVDTNASTLLGGAVQSVRLHDSATALI